jgi:hypothetical protein
MFKIGQKVLCIEGYKSDCGTWRLIEGKIYTVIEMSACKCEPAIHVGILGTGTTCRRCWHNVSKGKSFHRVSRFRPLDESFAEEVLEMIKEQINEEELITV